jgi:hypothetical protein
MWEGSIWGVKGSKRGLAGLGQVYRGVLQQAVQTAEVDSQVESEQSGKQGHWIHSLGQGARLHLKDQLCGYCALKGSAPFAHPQWAAALLSKQGHGQWHDQQGRLPSGHPHDVRAPAPGGALCLCRRAAGRARRDARHVQLAPRQAVARA